MNVLDMVRRTRRDAVERRADEIAAPFEDPLERLVLAFTVRYAAAAVEGRHEEAADLMREHLDTLRRMTDVAALA